MGALRCRGQVVLAGALFLTVSACAGPEAAELGRPHGSATGSVTSAPTTTASPAEIAGRKALVAYRGMWNEMVDAARTSDWQDPDLARHATRDALRVITGSLYADHKNGLITKGRPTYDPEVTSATPTNDPRAVMISDCGDSTDWIKYRKDTNKPVDGSSGGRRQITAEVKLQDDGKWRVTRFAVQGIGTC